MLGRRSLISGSAALGLGFSLQFRPALAQDAWPTRPIRIVVANPPGGIGDVATRTLADRAAVELGQPMVIENRPGGSTVIGTQFAARAEADGYTILNLSTSGIVQSVLQERLPYSLERDFVPIVGLGYFPLALVVPANSPITNLSDLRAAARQPNGVTFGSGGTGTIAHLASVRLLRELGGSGTHVPYRGNAEAIGGVLGGQLQMFFPSTVEAVPLAVAGQVKVLAVTSRERQPRLPGVPTTTELGLQDFSPSLWVGFMALARTPPPIVARLRDAFLVAAADPAVQQRLEALGFALDVKDEADSLAYISDEARRWQRVIEENSIRAGD